jgi:hypothetical protein
MSGLFYYKAPPALSAVDLALMATSPRQSTSAPVGVSYGILSRAVLVGIPAPVGVFAVAISSTLSFEKVVAMDFVKIIDLMQQIMTADPATNFQQIPSLHQAILNLNNNAGKIVDRKMNTLHDIVMSHICKIDALNSSNMKKACGFGNIYENKEFCETVCQTVEGLLQQIAILMGWANRYGAVNLDMIRYVASN